MLFLKFIKNSTLYVRYKQRLITASKYSSSNSRETHFGFETVLEDEKEGRVYEVFENVAEKYDVMNDSMSLGIHRLWKDYFMDRMAPTQGTQLLDVAGGTGDIAFRFLKYLENDRQENTGSMKTQDTDFDIVIPKDIIGQLYGDFDSEDHKSHTDNDSSSYSNHHINCESEKRKLSKKVSHVTVCDINQAMLDVGKKRSEEIGFKTGISWVQGNAECLPVADNTFDAYTIAFGIRNCTHIDQVLLEAFRVLKPGGRFMCLEFSQVTNPVLSRLYDEYSFQVIPVMGQIIAGDWKSYQYLIESIRKFPDQETFASLIRGAGFKEVTYENLMFGVSAIHSGFKL